MFWCCRCFTLGPTLTQVIRRNAPAPALPPPHRRPRSFDGLAPGLPPDQLAAFVFNKDAANKERYCYACRTLYRCV